MKFFRLGFFIVCISAFKRPALACLFEGWALGRRFSGNFLARILGAKFQEFLEWSVISGCLTQCLQSTRLICGDFNCEYLQLDNFAA